MRSCPDPDQLLAASLPSALMYRKNPDDVSVKGGGPMVFKIEKLAHAASRGESSLSPRTEFPFADKTLS